MRLAKTTEGELVDIADAASHNKFYCIDCNAILFPKNKNPKTRKRDIYFSHYGNCSGNLETYFHKLAKRIIEEEKKILLPGLGQVDIDSVRLEYRLESLIPDALLTDSSGQDIIIEIFVTHKTKSDKIQKIKATGLKAFEIDLSTMNYECSAAQVRFIVIESLSHKIDLNPPARPTHGNNDWLIWAILMGLLSWIAFRWRNADKRKRNPERAGRGFFR